jgi:hypothetical protein
MSFHFGVTLEFPHAMHKGNKWPKTPIIMVKNTQRTHLACSSESMLFR